MISRGSPGSVSRLVCLFSVAESTTGIGNWNNRRAQPQQGGSEMGYPGSPGTQKHRPQSAGTWGKHLCTDLICCSSLLHKGGAAASIPELFNVLAVSWGNLPFSSWPSVVKYAQTARFAAPQPVCFVSTFWYSRVNLKLQLLFCCR